jgi:hypothetical protein
MTTSGSHHTVTPVQDAGPWRGSLRHPRRRAVLVLCGAAAVVAAAVWMSNASDGGQRALRADVTAPAFHPALDVLSDRTAIAAAPVRPPAADRRLDVLFGQTAIAAGEASAANTPLADARLEVLFGKTAIAAGAPRRS